MATSLSSPEDLVNEALRALGYSRMIGDLYEGSPAARAALEIYAETRDELQRAEVWPFNRTANVALTLLKGPPPPGGYNPLQPWTSAYPPPGWLYEYAYPSDCLEVRAIQQLPGAMFDLDPRPTQWRIDYDKTLAPVQKVILSNAKSAMISYSNRVTNPALWEPGFIAAFIALLADKLSVQPQLASSPEIMKMAPQRVGAAVMTDRKLG